MDYKEKLRLAKEALESGSYDKETIEYIFPELKESEDERIRKELLAVINDLVLPDEQQSRFIAWLEKQGQAFSKKDIDDAYLKGICDAKKEFEKQGEKKPILDIEIPFGTDSELIEEAITIPDGCYAIIEDNKVVLRKGEQKPWSEEDEDYFDAIIAKLEVTQEDAALTDNQMNFLKSIKDRVQPQNRWKPSEEQMELLDSICASNYLTTTNTRVLQKLYDALKKLKG